MKLLGRHPQRRLGALAVFMTAALLLAACSSASSSSGSSSGSGSSSNGINPKHKQGQWTIALSNSFLGNTWRQTMVKVFQNTAQQAKSQGLIKDFRVANTSNNTATEQIAQIKSLMLQGVDAILIDSASPTALNPTIQQACQQGIAVVVFDSLASAPCEYNLQDSIADYGAGEAQAVAQGMHGKGNVLMVRGVVGSQPEAVIYQNQLKVLKQNPNIHIVGTVVGQASNSVTQQAVQQVLPSLPRVDGVITGGSSLGAIQAFQSANRPLPVVAFDNTGEALRFWQQQHQKTGYTASSVRTEPGQAAAAFWEAIELLQGKQLPKNLTFPILRIDQSNLDQWVKVTPNGNAACWLWTQQQFDQAVQQIQQGKPVPAPAVPTQAP